MYTRSRAVSAAALVVACAGCANHSAGPKLALTPAEAKWTGSIIPREQNTGQVAASRRTMINGDVTMVADRDYPTRTRIDLTIGSPVTNATVSWAVVPDRCGTGGVAVLPVNAFPPIEVGPSGRGEVSALIPFELPTQGSYHVDIYESNRATLADVQACADLKLSAR